VGGDILVACAQAKEREDFALDLIGQVGLVLLDQLGLESAGAVPWGLQFEAARGRFDGLPKIIAIIGLEFRVSEGEKVKTFTQ